MFQRKARLVGLIFGLVGPLSDQSNQPDWPVYHLALHLSIEEQHAFYPISQDAGKVSHEGHPRNTFHVPAKGYLL